MDYDEMFPFLASRVEIDWFIDVHYAWSFLAVVDLDALLYTGV